MRRLIFLTALNLLLATGSISAGNADRLYGKISTRDGQLLEGPIRWDRNEASWFDVLDGAKPLPERNRQSAVKAGFSSNEKREVRILGLKIAEFNPEDRFPSSSSSGIRFGHIRTLEPVSSSEVRLILKSGREVRLRGTSDIGRGMRGVIVEDRTKGKIELSWKDIETIEFTAPPEPVHSEFGERLFGTLISKDLGGFTGLVCWDVDEIFVTDVLDGREKGKKREVKFDDIASIERLNSRSAQVQLKTGEETTLSGTNDVNDGNRGILIMDPGIGLVRVSWSQFDKLVLETPADDWAPEFDGGKPLSGTVYTVGGKKLTGRIRWDNDEEYTWELLDGEDRDVQFEVEFGLIGSIEKSSSKSAVVTLKDGRSFELSGSNDVNADNKGIFVTLENGEEVAVRWADFRKAEF